MSTQQQDVASFLVTLDERVDISRAEEIFGRFEEALQRAENVDIDASAVERIDTTGFQILAAFRQAMDKNGRHTRFIRTSEALKANANLLGLNAILPVMDSSKG